MNTSEYYELFRYLMEQYCLFPEDIIFVSDIADWCREEGIPEPDHEKPLKLVSKEESGCEMLVKEYVKDGVLKERMNALRIRSQIGSVAVDRVDLLNTDRKKLAYLFLNEYAASVPDLQDELITDRWAFEEMERLGFFKQ